MDDDGDDQDDGDAFPTVPPGEPGHVREAIQERFRDSGVPNHPDAEPVEIHGDQDDG